jgi:hypothetical protein
MSFHIKINRNQLAELIDTLWLNTTTQDGIEVSIEYDLQV